MKMSIREVEWDARHYKLTKGKQVLCSNKQVIIENRDGSHEQFNSKNEMRIEKMREFLISSSFFFLNKCPLQTRL